MKSPGLAAVLSFFICGLGQIYNGQIVKGLIFLVAYFISWWMMYIVIGFITTPILWIWGIVDAYRVAQKINAQVGGVSTF
jgi:TM2 domain-containing membrane protein YozV